MSFMNMFNLGGAKPNAAPNNQQQQPNQQQQQQPNQQQNPNQPATNMQNGMPLAPGQDPQNSQNQQQSNPLDAYSKMWDNPSQSPAETAPSFSIDGKVLDTVTGQLDFTKGLDPNLVQKAMSGDAQSMFQVMQEIGKQAYRTSIEHGSHLTDKFVGARESFNEKGFSTKVRGELTNQALSDTPNFSHPVVKKQLTEVAKQLQKVHPDASPQEIAAKAKEYVMELAKALNPEAQNSNAADAAKKETNWDTFFDEQTS